MSLSAGWLWLWGSLSLVRSLSSHVTMLSVLLVLVSVLVRALWKPLQSERVQVISASLHCVPVSYVIPSGCCCDPSYAGSGSCRTWCGIQGNNSLCFTFYDNLSFCSITILAPDLFPLQRLLLHRLDEFLHSCLYACAYYDVILSVVLLFAKIRLSCRPKMSWRMEPGGVMCFSPTMEQFRDFSAFVAYMEDQGAHKFGIAKVQD